jgi:hypothetical protein
MVVCPENEADCSNENAMPESRNALPQLGYLVVAIFDHIANVFGRYPTTTTTKATTTATTTKTTTTTKAP